MDIKSRWTEDDDDDWPAVGGSLCRQRWRRKYNPYPNVDTSIGGQGNRQCQEWTADIDYETLEPLRFQSVGAYSETAFFHKPTKSLIVTDCVCRERNEGPAEGDTGGDPRALLFHARDSIDDVAVDDVPTR